MAFEFEFDGVQIRRRANLIVFKIDGEAHAGAGGAENGRADYPRPPRRCPGPLPIVSSSLLLSSLELSDTTIYEP